MKKVNILWSLLAIAMVTMLSVGFVSCGDDDDEDGGSSKNSVLVGTWRYSWNDSFDSGYTTLTFNSNGTGKVYEYHRFRDNTTSSTEYSFRYEVSSYDTYLGTAQIRYMDEYSSSWSTYSINVTSSTLVWIDRVTFIK